MRDLSIDNFFWDGTKQKKAETEVHVTNAIKEIPKNTTTLLKEGWVLWVYLLKIN